MPPPTGIKALRQRKSGSLPITRNCTISPKKRKRNKGSSFSSRRRFVSIVVGVMLILIFIACVFLNLNHNANSSSNNNNNSPTRLNLKEIITSLPLFRGNTKNKPISYPTYRCKSNSNDNENNGKAIVLNVPLNDNYCDCPQGDDENLTSACSHITIQKQIFVCDHGMQKIYSSRVNDVVQDCDYGSDENLSL